MSSYIYIYMCVYGCVCVWGGGGCMSLYTWVCVYYVIRNNILCILKILTMIK